MDSSKNSLYHLWIYLFWIYVNSVGKQCIRRAVWDEHLSAAKAELHVGDVFDWPLTFWVDEMLMPTVERTKVALPLVGNYYRLNAQRSFTSHKISVSRGASSIL